MMLWAISGVFEFRWLGRLQLASPARQAGA
jgi:hypothetical protein